MLIMKILIEDGIKRDNRESGFKEKMANQKE
jgi:hypothetical protein